MEEEARRENVLRMKKQPELGIKLMPTILQKGAFSGAFQKIKWAKQHIRNIERAIAIFNETGPNGIFAEDASELGQVQMSIDFGPFLRIMPTLRMMTGDAIHNMRCALDHLAWGIVSAFKQPDPYLYFPIDAERQSFISHRGFREIQSVAPDVADLLLNEVKPYGAGNQFVALNRLDRADKHRALVAHSASTSLNVYMAKDDNDIPPEAQNSFIMVANPTRIPRLGTKARLHNESYRGAVFDIRFDPGLPFENEPVIPTLHQLSQLVSGAIEILAAHCMALHLGADAQNAGTEHSVPKPSLE